MSPQTATLAARSPTTTCAAACVWSPARAEDSARRPRSASPDSAPPVVLLGRDERLLAAARDEVAAESGNTHVSTIVADLASFDAIRTGGRRSSARGTRRSTCSCTTRASTPRRRKLSADGIELTLAVNHLAPFLLTHELLPRCSALRRDRGARVVTVSSMFERFGRIAFDDLQGDRRWIGPLAYTQSKLANVLFTYELAERLAGTGITANCVDPGLVATDLMREHVLFRPRWLKAVWGRVLASPSAGARAAMHAASAPEIATVTGKCFDRYGKQVTHVPPIRNPATRERLWTLSEQLTGVSVRRLPDAVRCRTWTARPSGPPEPAGFPQHRPHEPPSRVLQPSSPTPRATPLRTAASRSPAASTPAAASRSISPDRLLVPGRLGSELRRRVAHRPPMRVEQQPRLQRRRPPKARHQRPRRLVASCATRTFTPRKRSPDTRIRRSGSHTVRWSALCPGVCIEHAAAPDRTSAAALAAAPSDPTPRADRTGSPAARAAAPRTPRASPAAARRRERRRVAGVVLVPVREHHAARTERLHGVRPAPARRAETPCPPARRPARRRSRRIPPARRASSASGAAARRARASRSTASCGGHRNCPTGRGTIE